MAVNLHHVVRSAIEFLHPDLDALLYRGRTREIGPDGSVRPAWAQKLRVRVQVQSDKTMDLEHDGAVGSEQIERKMYLHSFEELEDRVAGIVRPLSRPGDMVQVLQDGTWWLVTGVLEDFARSGWCCVKAVLQVTPPDLAFTPEPLHA